MSIKVMLADDHVLMREGIRQLLEFDGTISVIAEANNGVECMEQLLSVHPDILLLDINMPVMNGIEVLQEIKKKNISVKVLVLTVHNEVEYLLKAVDIGIDGYIMKDAESAELKKAINCIMQGETYIQPSLCLLYTSETIHGRAEDFAKPGKCREKYDLCVSRAVANLSTLSEYCLPFVKVGGKFISYKSEKITEEMNAAQQDVYKRQGDESTLVPTGRVFDAK